MAVAPGAAEAQGPGQQHWCWAWGPAEGRQSPGRTGAADSRTVACTVAAAAAAVPAVGTAVGILAAAAAAAEGHLWDPREPWSTGESWAHLCLASCWCY